MEEEEEEYNPFVFDLNELGEAGVNVDTVRENSPPKNENENITIITTEQKIIPGNIPFTRVEDEQPGPSTGRAGDFKLFSRPIKNADFILPNDGADIPLEFCAKELSKDKAKAEHAMRLSMDDQQFSQNSLDVALALIEYLSDLKHDLKHRPEEFYCSLEVNSPSKQDNADNAESTNVKVEDHPRTKRRSKK